MLNFHRKTKFECGNGIVPARGLSFSVYVHFRGENLQPVLSVMGENDEEVIELPMAFLGESAIPHCRIDIRDRLDRGLGATPVEAVELAMTEVLAKNASYKVEFDADSGTIAITVTVIMKSKLLWQRVVERRLEEVETFFSVIPALRKHEVD